MNSSTPSTGRFPRRRDDIATLRVGSSIILATESHQRPVVLDAVSGTIWEALDGTTPLAEVIEDVVAALGGDHAVRSNYVERLCEALAHDGLVDDPAVASRPVPRRLHPLVPADSCLGRRLSLGRVRSVQVRTPRGASLRFGSTISGLTAGMSKKLETVPLDDEPAEMIILRATASRSGRPRLQQMFDTVGNTLWAGRDLELAGSALRRTVTALTQLGAGPWLQAVAVASKDRAVVIHPALRDFVVEQARPILERESLRLVPTGLVGVDPVTGALVTPADGFRDEPPLEWNFGGVVALRDDDLLSRLCSLLYLAREWDQEHLDLVQQLSNAPIIPIEHVGSVDEVASQIIRACRSKN